MFKFPNPFSRLRDYFIHRRTMKMCNEARARMNTYTPEQRAELGKRAMEIINGKTLHES